jgi:pyruvate/2-oxoglutarate dehydrogenase complex dihydrolipoamide dehydrogenase (E3) component
MRTGIYCLRKERCVTKAKQYDTIVIGAGQSGGPLSTALARSGRKTAIIEREHVGGTCLNEGCTPTKTIVASARVAYLARRAADYGVLTGRITVDMERVRQRKRDIVKSFVASSERQIRETKDVDLLMGEARFIGPKEVEVKMNDGPLLHLTADLFFINVGARPSTIQLDGIESVPALNSTTIMELDSVPRHLIVLGGGSVGLEFAQMFRRFGSRVTVVQHGERLLGREDADVAESVAGILREDGIDVMLKTEALRVMRQKNGAIRLTVQADGKEHAIIGSHLLVAVGRTPNTDRLNPQAAGIELDSHGFIKVNDRLETNVPGIYALGDVNGGPAFTHISYDDFRIIKTNLIEGGNASRKGRMVPYVVYIDPQLGRIGMTEEEARKEGRSIKVARMPMSDISRAVEVDESRGFMKAIVDADTERILGAAVLGLEGGELMSMLEIAMMGNLPYPVLKEAIFAHPTLAEGLNNLFGSFEG